jgi:hypothetical protein
MNLIFERENEVRVFKDETVTFTEEFYINLNNWCVSSFGYHARTAYERYKFKNKKNLTEFIKYLESNYV